LRILKGAAFADCGPLREEREDAWFYLSEKLVKCSPDTGPAFDVTDRFYGLVAQAVRSGASLKSICIPASVETIGDDCFCANMSIRRVDFEAGSKLRVLGVSAFSGSAIHSIEIPPLVEVLPQSCFSYCAFLSSVTFAPGSQLRTIDGTAFEVSCIEAIAIPPLVEILELNSFFLCSSLSNLTFESNSRLRRLETQAILLCMSLTSVCIPSSVELIGDRCFSGCHELISVTFESCSKLATIEYKAFDYCVTLGPSIHLPSSLAVIRQDCFCNCESLQLITFDSDSLLQEIDASPFDRCPLKSFRIPPLVLEINWCCFDRQTEITFQSPSKLQRIIGFYYGRAGSFSIPDSVESLIRWQGGDRGFVCHFGVHSRLRDVNGDYPRLRYGFMRLSEPSLKRIRSGIEGR
jgi:hypothetical protein